MKNWILSFKPSPILGSKKEKLLSCVGAFLGLFLTERLSHWFLGGAEIWFIAPMGASAVLLFAVPSSPLAQPWSILGGNLVASFIGVTCAFFIPNPGVAAGVSVSLAIGAMFLLRCLHPPSGAVALTAVLGGPVIRHLGYSLILFPVILNSLWLVMLALVVNGAMGRRYPHAHIQALSPHMTRDPLPSARVGVATEDLDQALKEHADLLDVMPSDLSEVIREAEVFSHRRRHGKLLCRNFMSKDLIFVRSGELAITAWELMMRHEIETLPVIDDLGELVGVISLQDFVVSRKKSERMAGPVRFHLDLTVDALMTREVISAKGDQDIAELVGLLSDEGRHHLPVVNAQNQVIGMLTQSDVLGVLFKLQSQ